MTPDEVPHELVAIVDRAGPVATRLAEVLTRYSELTRPEILRTARDLTGRIQPARQARGLTQNAFALYEGISQTQLSGWERGVVEPYLSNAIRLAGVLGYDLALVPREERT